MAQGLRLDWLRSRPRISFLLEMVIVSAAALGVFVLWRRIGGTRIWFIGPLLLVAVALLPMVVRGERPAELGLQLGRTRHHLLLLGGVVVCLFIVTFVGVVLAKHLSVTPPLAVTLPQEQWFSWVLFQFAYVALPEELFFRGYFLSRSIRLLRMSSKSDARTVQSIGAILSAAFFAISHMLLWWNVAGLLTFIPGLIFAWLFVRMRSLFPPALVHGAANVAYALSIQAVF